MVRDSVALRPPGRGKVIEGQVWTDLATGTLDVEILKVFHMGSHAGHEHVLVLDLPRDQPLRNEVPDLVNDVRSMPRSTLEAAYSLTFGPNTTLLHDAVVHYVNCDKVA